MRAHTIITHLKNGSSELVPDPETVLTPDILHCERLWKDRGKKTSWPMDQWVVVKAAVGPLLYATIDPEDEHYAGGLLNPRGTIRSRFIKLLSCSFENGSIPIISAYARFELLFDRVFKNNREFYDWMDWGTNFGWAFPNGDEYNAAENDDGIELELITI